MPNSFKRASSIAATVLVLAAVSAVSLGALQRAKAAPEDPLPGSEAPGETTEPYTLHVDHWEGPIGQEGFVVISVEARKGHKINLRYPQRVTLDPPPEGVTLPKSQFDLEDAQAQGDKRLSFTVAAVPTKAGAYELGAQIKLSVCSDEQCRIDKRRVVARVTAQ